MTLHYHTKLEHLRNLVCVATADGPLNDKTASEIIGITKRMGLNGYNFERVCRVLNNGTLYPVEWSDTVIRKSGVGKSFDKFLSDLIRVACISDGVISRNKMKIINKILTNMVTKDIYLSLEFRKLSQSGLLKSIQT